MSQKSVRIEERLLRAELHQDHDLARALAVRLATLARELNRTSEAFVEHQAHVHPQEGITGSHIG